MGETSVEDSSDNVMGLGSDTTADCFADGFVGVVASMTTTSRSSSSGPRNTNEMATSPRTRRTTIPIARGTLRELGRSDAEDESCDRKSGVLVDNMFNRPKASRGRRRTAAQHDHSKSVILDDAAAGSLSAGQLDGYTHDSAVD